MNKRKIILLLVVLGSLFLLSGCSVPQENGKIILITDQTTFGYMINNEGWFSALFVFPLSKAINFLAPLTNVAIAIAIVTIIINGLILLFTFKATMDQQKMQALQPEILKIQKKYEGKTDQQAKMMMGQEMQAVYNKHNVNPLGSIAVMFLQFPVIIAMYQSVQRAESVSTGTFLGLSLEQTPLKGIQGGQYMYLVIFIVMILTQFIAMKLPQYLSEKRAREVAEKAGRRYEKQKLPGGNMMYGMMAIISVISISWPAAMTIYWIISSVVNAGKAVLVQHLINKNS